MIFIQSISVEGKSSNDLRFNTAFVLSSEDLEGTLVTPRFVPRVNDSPVRSSVFDTPTNHLDGMTTESLSGNVLVDTSLVGKEIFIDSQSNFDGSIGHDFGHNSILILSNAVSLRTLVDILGINVGRTSIARLGALGSGEFTSARRIDIRSDVVSARSEGVSLAPRVVSIKVTSNKTSLDVVLHSSNGVTTVATHTASRTTSKHVLSRESDILTKLNAVSVGDGFNSTESPTRTTVRLVSNFPKRSTLITPLSSRVKRFR